MADIYKQHDAAFANVAAFVVMKNGERVANIAFKFPRDGAGRLWAYVHWIGLEMVRGCAGGYGYDKRTAAMAAAARRAIDAHKNDAPEPSTPELEARRAFWLAVAADGGKYWDDCLRDAGFAVLQAV